MRAPEIGGAENFSKVGVFGMSYCESNFDLTFASVEEFKNSTHFDLACLRTL
jgi:hypothetical protein